MKKITSDIQTSDLYRFLSSFSPAARGALVMALPYIAVDALHYYTAGAALVLSTPVLVVMYMFTGTLAARFAYRSGAPLAELPAVGARAGVLLWLISTVVNSVIAVLIGAASLGLTLVLGLPFLLICGPALMIGSAIGGGLGGWFYRSYRERTAAAPAE